MDRYTRAAVVLVALAALLAGCSGSITAPERVDVATDSDAYEVRDVQTWTSGSTTEYKTQVVLTATVASAGDDAVPVPPVDVRFTFANGTTRSVEPTYELERRTRSFDAVANETLDPGDGASIRAILDPDGSVEVTNATVRVGQ